ncbi:serine/threonine protein kinase [Acetitomaculum ruminis DSM 5522]|uniref:non-specific serine/threonine protein kinase n=1 Tax=Acetitomaculum ruminis DSM 5522 TaxID=1120918 RepID=A0A1I0XWQ6_9FIRM|nr:Stk1 family PASTA domain-containing Ser/Thr kinase [Acetitomaculum ruminis]SFB04383.1 serine/threonine protein kinase [Acetitomaculum ruminis DSM 5522]
MLRQGDLIGGRYTVVSKVGSGGMSDVYKAKDNKLNRYVAIKVLKPEFSEDEAFVSKFRVEAQSAAGLAHPNIVNVYDVGDEDGIHYIVMELVEGITLKTYIEKKGRLSQKEAISVAIQVAKGIESAHNNHIIHRDIKPQNIIISKEGKVKVTDFGIARAASTNTINSNVMGSVHYISPEQARGGFVDSKSDIYSLGVTLYEMITGHVPFDADTAVSVAIKHIQDEIIPPSEYVPGLPISVEKIILKCTQKSPDRRYKNVTELIADLKHSLINPNEDFVKIIPGVLNDKTLVLSDEDLERIKRGILPEEDEYPQEEYNEGYEESYDENQEEYDDNYEDDYDEDEELYAKEDNEKELNPKLDKAITIGGIIVALVIVGIVIYIILSFAGVLKSTATKDKPSTNISTQEESDKVEMVNIVGKDYEDAKDELNKLGLGIKKIAEEESDVYPEGYVVFQSVSKGEKIKKNTTIEVKVSTGSNKTTVPKVVGMEQNAAFTEIVKAGLNYTTSQEYSDSVPEGCIISCAPGEGETVEKESNVNLVISKGEAPKTTTVPSVVGMNQAEAQSTLSNSLLNLGSVTQEYSDTVAKDLVISQDQTAGATVNQWTNVNIVISLGPEVKTTTVPSLAGMTQAQAEVAITAAGLTVGTVTEVPSDSITEGYVIDQSIASNTTVEEGTTVNFTVSAGQEDSGDDNE